MGNRLSLREVFLKEGNFKTLYHIGKHPASPRPPNHWEGEGWRRPWLKKPVEVPVVFMSDNWKQVRKNHGKWGNVYSYKVPMAAIKASGGLHTYDNAKEVLFTQKTWDKYNIAGTLSKKVIDQEKAEEIIKNTGYDTYSRWKMDYGGGKEAEKAKTPSWEKLLDLEPGRAKEAIKLIGKQPAQKMAKAVRHWIDTAEPKKAEDEEGAFRRVRQGLNNSEFRKKLDKALAVEKLLKSV